MDREEILRREDEGWATLMATVDRVPSERRSTAGVVPGWSVKDLLWHCGRWADWVREPLARISDGTYDPDREYPWEQMNEDWARESSEMGWDEVARGAAEMRAGARRAFEELPEVGEPAAKEFVDETIDHYAEHAEEIARFAEAAS